MNRDQLPLRPIAALDVQHWRSLDGFSQRAKFGQAERIFGDRIGVKTPFITCEGAA